MALTRNIKGLKDIRSASPEYQTLLLDLVIILVLPLFLQSASAFLDQYCEEPSVYL